MIQSMTGFGKATDTYQNKKITVELKSLNSKNLDLFVRLPSIYKSKEIELRKLIGSMLDRGKVECFINIEMIGDASKSTINKAIITSYYHQLKEISEELNLPNENLMQVLTKMPDVFTVNQDELDEGEWEMVKSLTQKASENLVEFRLHEGEQLKSEFELRIGNIEAAFLEVPKYEQVRIDNIKERIQNNLEEFIGLNKVDKNRYEQELIYYIEKIDIAEEKLRLSNHLDFFREVLSQSLSQGKKLGFISQEIGREINTLGSKSYHSDMQKLVVQMKDELEKIKEQILNTL